MNHYISWFDRLNEYSLLRPWVAQLRKEQELWFQEDQRGDVSKWIAVLDKLPSVQQKEWRVSQGRLEFGGDTTLSHDLLMAFHPWRKGPFKLGAVEIDTEWRSDWKWERISPHLNLADKTVLDIGCGNGYYLWRMKEAGAKWALGIDPYLPYVMQFQLMQHFAGEEDTVQVLPVGVETLPRNGQAFDRVFSMGVLYHQKAPIDHLAHVRNLLNPEGEAIIETIVLPPTFDKPTDCLVPEGRYAKMKNVYFLPSVSMLQVWLKKAKFKTIEVLDISKTSLLEQRATPWMTFESLSDFLQPDDESKTLEGHPAPWRVVIKASKVG